MKSMLPKPFLIESRELWFQLKQDYLLEDLLRPIFVWGCGLGVLLLLFALAAKDSRLKMTALLLLAASGLAIIPYTSLRGTLTGGRHDNTPQFRAHPASEFSPKASRLRRETRWVFLGLAGAAGAAAIWGGRPRLGPLLTAASVAGGMAATITGIWLEAYDARAMHYLQERGAALAPPPASEPAPRLLSLSGPPPAEAASRRFREFEKIL